MPLCIVTFKHSSLFKTYGRCFTLAGRESPSGALADQRRDREAGEQAMSSLVLAMFIGLFAFGHEFVGWSDPDGHVKMALIGSYILGALFGYRSRA